MSTLMNPLHGTGTDPTQPVKRAQDIDEHGNPRTGKPNAAGVASTFTAGHLANGDPVINSYLAYWAIQPAPVQALRPDLMPNEADRNQLAHTLADQGFTIDVPIMVWNWDPLATMTVRKNQGYTWVPSAKMSPVAVAPGLSFPGLPSYDPKNPPAGSIMVSTDFAHGLETTDPWLYNADGTPRE